MRNIISSWFAKEDDHSLNNKLTKNSARNGNLRDTIEQIKPDSAEPCDDSSMQFSTATGNDETEGRYTNHETSSGKHNSTVVMSLQFSKNDFDSSMTQSEPLQGHVIHMSDPSHGLEREKNRHYSLFPQASLQSSMGSGCPMIIDRMVTERDELLDINHSLQKQLEATEASLKETVENNTEMKKKADQNGRLIVTLQKKLEKANIAQKEIAENYQRVEGELSKLNAQNNANMVLEGELREALKEKSTHAEKYHALLPVVTMLRENENELQNEVNVRRDKEIEWNKKSQESNQRIEEQAKEIKTLQEYLKESTQKLFDQEKTEKQHLETQKKHISDLHQQLQEQTHELEQVQTKIKNQEEEKAKNAVDVERSKQAMEEITTKLNLTQNNLQQSQQELAQAHTTIKNQEEEKAKNAVDVERSKQAMEEITTKLNLAQNNLQQSQQELAQAHTTIKNQEEEKAKNAVDVERSKQAMEEITTKLDLAQNNLQQSQQELTQAHTTIKNQEEEKAKNAVDVERSKQAMEEIITKLNLAQNNLQQSQQELAQAHTTIKNQEEEQAKNAVDVERSKQAMEEITTKLNLAQNNLQQSQQELAQAHTTIKNQEEEKAKNAVDVERSKQAMEEITTKLNLAQNNLQQSQQELTQAHTTIKNQEEEKAKNAVDVERSKQAMEEIITKLNLAQNNLQQSQQELAQAHTTIKNQEEEKAKNAVDVERSKQAMEEITTKLNLAQNNLQQSQQELAQAHTTIKNQEEEKAKNAVDVERSKQAMEEIITKLNLAQNDLQQSQQELEQSKGTIKNHKEHAGNQKINNKIVKLLEDGANAINLLTKDNKSYEPVLSVGGTNNSLTRRPVIEHFSLPRREKNQFTFTNILSGQTELFKSEDIDGSNEIHMKDISLIKSHSNLVVNPRTKTDVSAETTNKNNDCKKPVKLLPDASKVSIRLKKLQTGTQDKELLKNFPDVALQSMNLQGNAAIPSIHPNDNSIIESEAASDSSHLPPPVLPATYVDSLVAPVSVNNDVICLGKLHSINSSLASSMQYKSVQTLSQFYITLILGKDHKKFHKQVDAVTLLLVNIAKDNLYTNNIHSIIPFCEDLKKQITQTLGDNSEIFCSVNIMNMNELQTAKLSLEKIISLTVELNEDLLNCQIQLNHMNNYLHIMDSKQKEKLSTLLSLPSSTDSHLLTKLINDQQDAETTHFVQNLQSAIHPTHPEENKIISDYFESNVCENILQNKLKNGIEEENEDSHLLLIQLHKNDFNFLHVDSNKSSEKFFEEQLCVHNIEKNMKELKASVKLLQQNIIVTGHNLDDKFKSSSELYKEMRKIKHLLGAKNDKDLVVLVEKIKLEDEALRKMKEEVFSVLAIQTNANIKDVLEEKMNKEQMNTVTLKTLNDQVMDLEAKIRQKDTSIEEAKKEATTFQEFVSEMTNLFNADKIDNLQIEIKRLKTEYEDLKKAKEELDSLLSIKPNDNIKNVLEKTLHKERMNTTQLQNLKDKVMNLEATIHEKDKSIQEAKIEATTFQTSLSEMAKLFGNKNIDTLQIETQRLKTEYDALRKMKEELHSLLSIKPNDNIKNVLEKTLHKERINTTQLENLKDKVMNLEATIHEKDKSIQEAKTEATTFQTSLSEMAKLFGNKNIDTLQIETQRLKTEYDALRKMKEELHSLLSIKPNDNIKNVLEKTLHKERIHTTQLENLKDKVMNLEATIHEKDTSIEEAKKEATTFQEFVSEMTNLFNANKIDNLRIEIKRLKTEYEDLKKAKEELHSLLSIKPNDNIKNVLEKTLHKERIHTTQVENLKDKVMNLEATIHEKDTSIKEAKKEATTFQEFVSEMTNLFNANKIDNLRIEIKRLKTEYEDLKKAKEELHSLLSIKPNDNIKNVLEKTLHKERIHTTQVENLKDKVMNLEATIHEKDTSIEEAKKETTTFQEFVSEMTNLFNANKIDNLRIEIKRLKTEYEDLKKAKEELHSLLSIKPNDNIKNVLEKTLHKERIHTTQVENLKDKVMNLEATIHEKDKSIQETKIEATAFQESLSEMRKLCSTDKISNLQLEINQLTVKNTTLNSMIGIILSSLLCGKNQYFSLGMILKQDGCTEKFMEWHTQLNPFFVMLDRQYSTFNLIHMKMNNLNIEIQKIMTNDIYEEFDVSITNIGDNIKFSNIVVEPVNNQSFQLKATKERQLLIKNPLSQYVPDATSKNDVCKACIQSSSTMTKIIDDHLQKLIKDHIILTRDLTKQIDIEKFDFTRIFNNTMIRQSNTLFSTIDSPSSPLKQLPHDVSDNSIKEIHCIDYFHDDVIPYSSVKQLIHLCHTEQDDLNDLCMFLLAGLECSKTHIKELEERLSQCQHDIQTYTTNVQQLEHALHLSRQKINLQDVSVSSGRDLLFNQLNKENNLAFNLDHPSMVELQQQLDLTNTTLKHLEEEYSILGLEKVALERQLHITELNLNQVRQKVTIDQPQIENKNSSIQSCKISSHRPVLPFNSITFPKKDLFLHIMKPVKMLLIAPTYRRSCVLQHFKVSQKHLTAYLLGKSFTLSGCENDIDEWCRLLPLFGWSPDTTRVLSEARGLLEDPQKRVPVAIPSSPLMTRLNELPTKKNILEGLDWLTTNIQPNERILLIMIGAGTLVPISYTRTAEQLQELIHQQQEKFLLPQLYDPCFLPCDFIQSHLESLDKKSTNMAVHSTGLLQSTTSSPTVDIIGISTQQILSYFNRLPSSSSATIIWDFGLAQHSLVHITTPGIPPVMHMTKEKQKEPSPKLFHHHGIQHRMTPRYFNLEDILNKMHSICPTLKAHYDFKQDSIPQASSYHTLSCHLFFLTGSSMGTNAYETLIDGSAQGVFSWALRQILLDFGFQITSEELQRQLPLRIASLQSTITSPSLSSTMHQVPEILTM